MKNVQVIDGAINSAFSIYSIPNDAFRLLFPESGQDIEFIEDAIVRLGQKRVGNLMKYTWNSRLQKSKVRGIHGTLFIGLLDRKPQYPSKRETDLDNLQIQKTARGLVATRFLSGAKPA